MRMEVATRFGFSAYELRIVAITDAPYAPNGGKSGYNARDDTPKVTGEVDFETYKKVIDEVTLKKVHVYITGGEPFLYDSLVPLVNYIKQKGLTIQIVTNGVGLEKNAQTIVENGWDMICVSFDGPRKFMINAEEFQVPLTLPLRGFQQFKK